MDYGARGTAALHAGPLASLELEVKSCLHALSGALFHDATKASSNDATLRNIVNIRALADHVLTQGVHGLCMKLWAEQNKTPDSIQEHLKSEYRPSTLYQNIMIEAIAMHWRTSPPSATEFSTQALQSDSPLSMARTQFHLHA